MYRCEVCYVVSQPGASQLRYPYYHQVEGIRQILCEVPVCRECLTDLAAGESYQHACSRKRPYHLRPQVKPPSSYKPEEMAKVVDVLKGKKH